MNNPRRVLILMSDTGGGHRAAAEAIQEALVRRHGDAVAVEMVDVFKSYSPIQLKFLPELSPGAIKNGKLVGRVSYARSNRKAGVRLINISIGGKIHRGLRQMLLREHQGDVIEATFGAS